MSTAANTAPSAEVKPASTVPWATVAWFFGLLVLAYAPVLWRLGVQWTVDEDMGHGFFVVPIAAYIAWLRRDQLFAGPVQHNKWGLVVIVYAALQLALATLGAEIFLARTALILSITGCVLYLGGPRVLRAAAFPIVLLCFMISIPAMIYAQITLPLQMFASSVAEKVLSLIGIPVLREGNVLHLPSQDLSVVEACSGIRSLLSLSFLSLVYGFFFDRRPWMRWVLLALTVPIAILANAGRVTLSGVFSEINPELARGLYHSAEGWVIFMIALAILVAAHQLVSVLVRVYGKSR